jgi:hypothetical protein
MSSPARTNAGCPSGSGVALVQPRTERRVSLQDRSTALPLPSCRKLQGWLRFASGERPCARHVEREKPQEGSRK